MEQRSRELNSFEELVEKAVDAKARRSPAPLLCLRDQSILSPG